MDERIKKHDRDIGLSRTQTSTVSENEDQNLGYHNGDDGENVT